MLRKLIITTLAGTAIYFVFGWLIFDVLLGGYTGANTTQLSGFKKNELESSFMLLILSCGAYAALLSFILVYLLNLKNLVKAFFIAATIGILVAMMTDSYWYATSHFYSNATVVVLDVIAAGITVGVSGVVITFINKKLR